MMTAIKLLKEHESILLDKRDALRFKLSKLKANGSETGFHYLIGKTELNLIDVTDQLVEMKNAVEILEERNQNASRGATT